MALLGPGPPWRHAFGGGASVKGHRWPWLDSGRVSSSVSCVASTSVSRSAGGHLRRVVARIGGNEYGKTASDSCQMPGNW